MKIDLNQDELAKVLKEKYPDASFRVFYTETDEEWEGRTGVDISKLVKPPEKNTYCLYF